MLDNRSCAVWSRGSCIDKDSSLRVLCSYLEELLFVGLSSIDVNDEVRRSRSDVDIDRFFSIEDSFGKIIGAS